VFSRIVYAVTGQMVEIPLRGTGWVYLGEVNSRRGMGYESRRTDPEGQTVILKAESPGTYELKFYKQDLVQDYTQNDYVRVIVANPAESGTSGRSVPAVVAEPRWPLSPGAAAVSLPVESGRFAAPANSAANSAAAVPGNSPVEPPNPATAAPQQAQVPQTKPEAATGGSTAATPEEYLRRAQEAYGAGQIAQGLGTLDQFREQFPRGNDEALWLYGQMLEANSPRRDIRAAADCYRQLIQEYPESSRYAEARRRIAYLDRYYFNIQ
jgi:hypothetical protein